jgi:hypothetical protein
MVQPLRLNLLGTAAGATKGASKHGNPRKHYDNVRIVVEGRRKYESAVVEQKSMFVEELLEWLRNSKHDKQSGTEKGTGGDLGGNNLYTRQEVMKLQALYYEERRKCTDLQTTVARLERRNDELERLASSNGGRLADY